MKDVMDNVSKIPDRFSSALSKWFSVYTGNEEGNISSAMLKRTARGVLSLLCAVLFSSARGFGLTYPFGVALICGCERNFYFVLTGVMIGSYFATDGVIYMISGLLAAVLRFVVCLALEGKRGRHFCEPVPLRMAIGSAGGFVAGVYGIFMGGFKEEQLYEAFFLILFVPIAVYMFSSALSANKGKNVRRDLSSVFIYGVFVTGLSGISIAGFSPSIVCAVLLTLCTALNCGAVRGALTGMIGALCCGYSSVALGLLGGAAGGVKKRSSILGIACGCVAGVAAAFLYGGSRAIVTSVPAILWGGGLCLPILRFGHSHRLSVFEGGTVMTAEEADAALLERKKREDMAKKITSLSEAMSSLSGVFYALSNRLSSPGVYTVRQMCEGSFKKYCSKCSLSTRCWGRNYENTADVLNKLASAIASHGCADSSYVEREFLISCPHAMKALTDVNLSHARMLEEAARQNKTEVFALDYEAMAKLLSEASEENSAEYQADPKLSERARRAALQLGMSFINIAVYGKRKKTLVAGGVELSRVKASASEIKTAFSTACGVQFTVPEYKIDDGYVLMTAASAPAITVESARATSKKKSEEVNGDSTSVFENRENMFYALISDGMGSGEDASVTSKITAVFLEKLLCAGNKKSTVLKMLNNFIRNKNLECFTTVDLLEIDTITSEASFVKSGAAASYIIRDGKLFKIASSSLPIGITREISSEEIRFELKNGDLIVMISDGVSQSFEDGAWLLSMLSEEIDADAPLADIAKSIIEKAKINNGRNDDMSVVVLRAEADS